MANLTTLAKRVSKALDVPERATKAICEQLLDEIAEALLAGDDVYLHRFGSFRFALQRTHEEFYRERGIVPEDEEMRLRICRFKFVRTLREKLNGIETGEPVDPDRIDYKERRSGVVEVNGETEAERRARAGITLGDIIKKLNSEVGA